ncbi:MAG: zinc-ribbon domain-containing protein [Pyrinomonadaceae bacterium]
MASGNVAGLKESAATFDQKEVEMGSDKILKKIQKKQRMLLKVLTSRSLDSDREGRLEKIATGLRLMGLVDSEALVITQKGREFAANFGHIFDDVPSDDEVILDKLLQRLISRDFDQPKVSKRERLFLAFLADGPVNKVNIRGGKLLIPHLSSEGKILVSADEVGLTDLGRQSLDETVSLETKNEAKRRFFTTARVDGRSRLEDRAERFLALYRNGFTYQEIGDLHSLTRERVRQILNVTPNFAAYLEEHEEAERQREIDKRKDVKFRQLEKSLANQFPDRVDELWDREKNVGLDPTQIASRSASVEIWWRCPKDGHSWKKRPCDIVVSWWRSGTSGCPRCAGKTRKPVKQGKLADVYPEFVERYWDFEKNQGQDLHPDKLTLASNRSVWFRCPKDSHTWQARIHATVKQQWSVGNAGCRVCNGTIDRRIGEWGKASKISEEFPEQVNSYWDFEQNDKLGLSPSEITVGSSKAAWFRCQKGGHSWSAKIVAIRQSWKNGASGCPTCHGRSKGESFKLADRYPSQIAEVWDFEQNEVDGLSYERLTTGSNKIGTFKCPDDGTIWQQQIKEIVKYWEAGKNGCPMCTKGRRIREKTS